MGVCVCERVVVAISFVNEKNGWMVSLTLLSDGACSRNCRCLRSLKNMKALLNLFGASGAFLYLVMLPFRFGIVLYHLVVLSALRVRFCFFDFSFFFLL